MKHCTCKVGPLTHEFARASTFRYAVYLDDFDDNTVTDPACPYHGDHGTMVLKLVIKR